MKDYRDRIIPLLFSISITIWVLDSLTGEIPTQILLLVFVLHSVVFTGMTQAGKSNLRLFLFVMGTLLYFAAITAMILSTRDSYGTRYMVWLATLQPGNATIAPFRTATVFLVCYMFSAIVFYFSCIRDRIGILFMTGCIPLILHTAKTNKGITLPFVLFVIVFFCLYIGKNRKLTLPQASNRYRNWYLAPIICFVLIVLGLSLILPKPLTSPKLAELDSVVFQAISPLINATPGEEQVGMEFYTLKHDPAQMELDKASFPTSDRILFLVEADEPLYLREQSRNRYERNQWIADDSILMEGYPISYLLRRHLKLNALAGMLSTMEEQDLLKLGFQNPEGILTLLSHPQEAADADIRTNRVQTNFFLTMPGVYGLETEVQSIEATINELGSCYSSLYGMPGVYDKYRLQYISQDISPVSTEMAVTRQMNAEVYRAFSKNRLMLYEKYEDALKKINFSEAEMMAIFFEADQELQIANENFTDLPPDLPERIYELAESITSGETSDYDKAKALENYFHSAGFRYDLTPPRLPYGRDINDYFLFESKRGFCVHFASAMVILARACGLPARYTEGYLCNEWDEQKSSFIVRVNDGHAFPEIYIAGVGWMVFEPTVSAESGNGFSALIQRISGWLHDSSQYAARLFQALPTMFKLLFIPFILLGVFYLLWLFALVRYRTWLKRTMRVEENLALKRIFIRIVTLMKNVRVEMKKSDTPSRYADRVLAEKGIDFGDLAQAYNKTRYGVYRLSSEELRSAMKRYQEIAACIKTQVRRPKAWLIR